MHTHGIFMMLANPHGNKRIGFQKGNFQIIIEIIEKKNIFYLYLILIYPLLNIQVYQIEESNSIYFVEFKICQPNKYGKAYLHN